MNGSLVVLGILMMAGMFFVGHVMITPQERSQIELSNSLCDSPLSSLVGAFSSGVAEECEKVGFLGMALSLEPFIYLIGFVFLVIGLALPKK